SYQAPWSSLGECGEQYCLVWESRFLRDLGSAMTSLLDGLVSMVAQEALKYTVLSGIVTALTWPASLLAAASVIDNPWCVCLNRSAEVGKHLAQVLRSRQQGKRPVSLIGFSLGARVIYYCLQELASDKGSEGVVEDVVLLGAPVDGSEKSWERMVRVVAGRIVNGYCRGVGRVAGAYLQLRSGREAGYTLDRLPACHRSTSFGYPLYSNTPEEIQQSEVTYFSMSPFLFSDPGGAAATADHESEKMTSRQLTEQSRFAFAALCAVSLGQLFSASENSAFREQYLQDLVQWLGLDQSVMPVMGAFLSGLGSEGTDTFLSILQADPLVAAGTTPIIQDLVSLSVKDGQYDARARVLIRHVSCLLRVSPQQLEEFEETLEERLREAGEESEEESSRRRRRERGRKLRRYLLIGLATVGGGTVIGVTGGLAAPLVAAGASAVLGASGAAALGSAAGIAIMASLFGAAGAGLTGYKMNKCVGAIEEFEFRPMSSGKHLHLTIAVTGWLCSGKY
ncbi:hypothetical protein CCH79_00017976, partial [Gambusia affinis]